MGTSLTLMVQRRPVEEDYRALFPGLQELRSLHFKPAVPPLISGEYMEPPRIQKTRIVFFRFPLAFDKGSCSLFDLGIS